MLRMLLVEAATATVRFDRSLRKSICIAATRSRKRWPRWRRRTSWPYDCTGCCAPTSRIRTSFVSRAARGCPWSVRTRPRMLIGRSRIPRGWLQKWKTKKPFSTSRRRGSAAAGCSHKRIMVAVGIESMGGGTTSSAEEMIQREISRVLVLNLSGQRSGAPALPRRSLSLTAPSLLSKGHPSPAV